MNAFTIWTSNVEPLDLQEPSDILPASTGNIKGRPATPDLGLAFGAQSAPFGFQFSDPDLGDFRIKGKKYRPTRRSTSEHIELFIGYSAWWFERMHTIPTTENVGTILSAVESRFYLHNAFRRTNQVLTSIDITGVGFEGTTVVQERTGLTSTAALPIPVNSHQGEGFTFTIPQEGPTTIDMDFDMSLQSGAPVQSFNVIGSRAVLFPFIPQRPVKETIEFLTNIIESRDGTETRISARAEARQEFGMDYLIDQQDPDMFQKAQALLVGNNGIPLGVGMWQQTGKITAPVAINDEIIYLDTTGMDLRVGGYLVLWRDWNDTEILGVEAFDATSVTTTTPITLTWDTGSYCVPMQLCVAKDRPVMSRTQNNVADFKIKWESQETTDTLSDHTGLYSTLYKGSPVLTDYHLMAGNKMAESYVGDYSDLDYGIGVQKLLSRKAAPAVTTSRMWEADTPADTMALRRFIYWARGKQKSFWFPTHRKDFTLAEDILAGDTQIVVTSQGYARDIGVNAPWNFISITKTDGTVYYRELVSAVEDVATGLDTIQIDLAPGQDILVADIHRISFLFRARFTSDKVTLTHKGQGYSSTGIGLMGVKQ